MKSNLMKYLIIFLLAATAILVVLLVFGLVLALGWPWWLGIVFLFILGGMIVGLLFLRRLWRRKREQQFVQQVIDQDEAQLRAAKGKERDEFKELQDRWKDAVQTLRSSHLKKSGNPLYALPWYLVLGESGSGKTTAIGSARLSSPFAEQRRTSGPAGTRNCDWWFFEQAIILDTAGRYAVPVDEGRDKDEWQKFLTLLAKYRKREPLNGLIVAIAADKLLNSPIESLQEDGKTIRRRIDELMRSLGVKFPVYLLVTKCDLIQGMTQFCDRLPEQSLDQAMGAINKDRSSGLTTFFDSVMKSTGERLRNLRSLLLHVHQSKNADPRLLLFPEEFDNLRNGLRPFMEAAFQDNPYQETPVLRGVFFSSGRQEGSPYSRFLNALGLIGEKDVLPGTARGLFLHDFFEKILPKDRGLFAPTKRAIEWSRLTRNLGLISWILIGVALCGLLSFSFVKNLRTLRGMSNVFAKPPELKGELLTDLIAMDQISKAIVRVEEENQGWWIPRFGLRESMYVEGELKEKFARHFQHGFLTPFDRQMSSVMASQTSSAPDEEIGRYAAHLTRRINILKSRLDNEALATLKTLPQPPAVALFTSRDQGVQAEERQMFGSLFLYSTLWRKDIGEINKELDILRSWLRHLLSLKGANLQWLVAWENSSGTGRPVTLGDFWGGAQQKAEEKTISPGFTRKGKESIDSFVREIETALPEPVLTASAKKAFEIWYSASAFEVWKQFAAGFPEGAKRLQGEKEWQIQAELAPLDRGAYFAFLNRIASDLEPLTTAAAIPPWLDQVYQFQTIKKMGSQPGFVVNTADKLFSRIEKTIKTGGGEVSDTHLAMARAYHEYAAALTAITGQLKTRNQAYQAVAQAYAEDPSSGKSPFLGAINAASSLKNGLMKGAQADDAVWGLIAGPLNYLGTFAGKEAACALQSQWEEKVLPELQGGDLHAMQVLVKQDNPVSKFVKGTAEPFLGWKAQRGYAAKEVLPGGVPFDPVFLSFLNKGVDAPKMIRPGYSVVIKGMPTDANRGARIKPHGTRLELQCAGANPQLLMNLHYPISKTLLWSPEGCGSVLFQIEVSNLMLTKKYEGPQAFPAFLHDFGTGTRTFFPWEFPAEKAALEKLGIKYIKVNYLFGGEYADVRQFVSMSGRIPRSIASCWN